MKKRNVLRKRIIFVSIIIILLGVIGFFAYKKFYHVKIILPIDTPEEAIEIVKQNMVLIEGDLRLNNRSINTLFAQYSKIGSIYDTAHSVLISDNAPKLPFYLVAECSDKIYVHVDKINGKVKYIEFTTCSGKPTCKNFKCIVWNEIPPEELYNPNFCESLNEQKIKDLCRRDRLRYIEKGIIPA